MSKKLTPARQKFVSLASKKFGEGEVISRAPARNPRIVEAVSIKSSSASRWITSIRALKSSSLSPMCTDILLRRSDRIRIDELSFSRSDRSDWVMNSRLSDMIFARSDTGPMASSARPLKSSSIRLIRIRAVKATISSATSANAMTIVAICEKMTSLLPGTADCARAIRGEPMPRR